MSAVDELEQLLDETDVVIDRWVVSQLEDQFRCECVWDDTGRCKQGAVFIGHCRFCEYSKFACVECRERHYTQRRLMSEPFISCNNCGRPARTVDELLEWLAIRAAA